MRSSARNLCNVRNRYVARFCPLCEVPENLRCGHIIGCVWRTHLVAKMAVQRKSRPDH